MAKIKNISALQILDSRGNPTVRAMVELDNKVVGFASVPSGASTGVHEALELRDGGQAYLGKGVTKAVKNIIQKISPALKGQDISAQAVIDQKMIDLDGTENKSKLGANAILAVSLAAAHAGARSADMPLFKYIRKAYGLKYKDWKMPMPTMNIINGGVHADWAMDIQEFMIVPQQKRFSKKIQCGAEIFHVLGKLLKKQGYPTLKGDEGGYAPELGGNEKALKLIMKAIEQAGYKPGTEVKLATDIAASEFYNKKNKQYELKTEGKSLTSMQMIDLIERWASKYPFVSIEDPLDQDDWDGWHEATKRLGKKVSLVGDDLFVTNSVRLQKGIDSNVGNAILIKLNQIGTLTETIEAIELAHAHGYKTAVSHRSGETEDTTLADLAVAVNSEFIKTGSLSRSERVAKYNRLLEIEQLLGL